MFEKTQKAARDLSLIATHEATEAVTTVKAAVVPTVAGFFGTLADYANKVKEGIESGELFKPLDANEEAKSQDGGTFADPLPTKEQNAAIHALRVIGKTDEEIADTLNVSLLTVKMATPLEA